MRADAIDPQIDRHGMAQVAQMREPDAWQRVAIDLPRRASAERSLSAKDSYGDIARRLAEIDRFDDFVEAG